MLYWMRQIGVIFFASTAIAQACLYDGLVVNTNYPGSLAVSLATQSALQNNMLAAVPKLSGQDAKERSLRHLALLRNQLEASEFRGKLSILLVDGELWSQINEQPGFAARSVLESNFRLQLTTHTQEPATGEPILLISEAALAALVSEQMTLQQAQDLGVARMKLAVDRPGFKP